MANKAKTVSKVVKSLEGLSKKLKLKKTGDELASTLRGMGDKAGDLEGIKIFNSNGFNNVGSKLSDHIDDMTKRLGERGGYKNLSKSEQDFLTKLGYEDPIQKKAAAAASANNGTSAAGKAAKEAVEEEEKARAWYDTDASRANLQQKIANQKAQDRTAFKNDIAGYKEEYNKIAGKHRDANGVLDEKNQEVIDARKKMEDSIRGRFKTYRNDARERKRMMDEGPGIMDWVQGNNIDSTIVGIGALGFAGAVAFGGAKSNADLYSAGSLTPGY